MKENGFFFKNGREWKPGEWKMPSASKTFFMDNGM